MKQRFRIKLKDILVIFIALLLCVSLGYLAFTAQKWWEWCFLVVIVGLMGLQARDYLLWR